MSSTCAFLLLTLVGTSLAAEEPNVTGHEVTDISLRPWHGAIYEGFNFVCSCSLISHEWAVTTASCVQNPPYNVAFGSLDRRKGEFRSVQEIVYHENFTTSGVLIKYNDIAVLKFAPVQLSFTISNIKLSEGETCHVSFFTGWGLPRYDAVSQPLLLHEATVSLVSSSKCEVHWPASDRGHICTDTADNGSPSPCWGDTGGPLVCINYGQPRLIGISSWQYYYCNTGWYPVYTDVLHYRQWIKDKTDV